MPITFNEARSIPDIIGNDRFVAYFPNLPGDGYGKDLSLRNVEVNIPPYEIAQVIVKILGWSLAFAGRRVQNNSMTMAFYEDVDATTSLALLAWQRETRGFVRAGGLIKNEYAREVEIKLYDTTGKTSMVFRANNVWPMRVTIPPFSEESHEPARIEVDFSVDSVDYLALVDESGGTSYGDADYTSPSAPSYKRIKHQGTIPGSSHMLPQIGMTVAGSVELMNSFLRTNVSGRISFGPNGLSRSGGVNVTDLGQVLLNNTGIRF